MYLLLNYKILLPKYWKVDGGKYLPMFLILKNIYGWSRGQTKYDYPTKNSWEVAEYLPNMPWSTNWEWNEISYFRPRAADKKNALEWMKIMFFNS